MILDQKRHTPLSTSMELRWSKWTVLGSWESASQRTCHGLHTEAQKRLYILRKLKKAKFPCQVLVNFYRGAIESILTGNITNWHVLWTAQDRRAQQQVIKTTQNIIGTYLLSISDISEVRCLHRAQRILKDSTHPNNSLFTLLLSGKRYRSIRCCTTRLQSSFFLQAVRLLNSPSALHQCY